MNLFAKISRFINWDRPPIETAEEMSKRVKLEELLIEDLTRIADCSVRLQNCLKNPDFPFKTVADYVSHINPIEAVKRVQNAGRKTATELDAIVKNFMSQPDQYLAPVKPEKSDQEERILAEAIKLFSAYKFPDIAFSLNISVRLANVLRAVQEDEGNPFPTLADCLSQPERISSYFMSRQSMGRKTLAELQALIRSISSYILEKNEFETDEQAYLSNILAKEVPNFADVDRDALLGKLRAINDKDSPIDLLLLVPATGTLNLERPDTIDDASIASLMQEILNEREFDVVSRRTSLGHKKVDTLDEIASTYNCTRERIRQIEQKSFRKLSLLKKVFIAVLKGDQLEIEEALFEEADYFSEEEQARQFKKLQGKHQLAILVAYRDFDTYLKEYHKKYKSFWVKSSRSEEADSVVIKEAIDSGSAANSIKKRIIEVLYKLSWPIHMKDLESALPEVSPAAIVASLKKDFGAEIVEGKAKLSAERLKSSLRLILTLRHAGRAVTLSEIRYFHIQIFDVDINEHIVGAVLGRLEEALIVDRGKYALYENISLTEKDVASIRKSCWDYLNKSQAYVSAKRIFDELFLGQHSFGAEFNPYMLLGIVQDDSRFVCKRGLMLGLNTFSEDDFVALNDQIYEIVNNYGPIDIRGIQSHLKAYRKVLDVTVGIMLDESDEHIKVAASTYDRMSRVLGDEDVCLKLKRAIEIALLDHDLSLFSLQERIGCVGFDLNKYVLLSWLDKQENIDRSKSIVHLASPSSEVNAYNKKYLHMKETCSASTLHVEAMNNALKADSPFMAAADYRLTGKTLSTPSDSEGENELDNLFKEFSF